jgi:exosome complex RNA-binding protein Rrp42 (RNase PH superfamily)
MAASTVSADELKYCLSGVNSNVRSDGRSITSLREFDVSHSNLLQSNGSARIYSHSGGGIDIVASVKATCTRKSRAQALQSPSLFVSVELSPLFVSKHKTKNKSIINSELSSALHDLLSCSLALPLAIVDNTHYWELNVDCMILNAVGGNVLDACARACYVALNVARLPFVTPVENTVSATMNDFIVDGDYTKSVSVEGARACPIAITLYKVGRELIQDATAMEESCASAFLSVSVDADGNVCGMRKGGAGSLDAMDVKKGISMAVDASRIVFAKLGACINQAAATKLSFTQSPSSLLTPKIEVV